MEYLRNAFFDVNPLFLIITLLFFMIILIALYALEKLRKINVLQRRTKYLDEKLIELDNEARLIIKTDMELKHLQEEVDDKLNKLHLLRDIIISLINITDKDMLFSKINREIINRLGFKKGAIITCEGFDVKTNVDFTDEEIGLITDFLKKKAVDSKATLLSFKKDIKHLEEEGGLDNIIISPVTVKAQIYGFFILANLIATWRNPATDEEIVHVICMYISKCLDNIELFETLYKSKHELEGKIKARTQELAHSLREVEKINKLKSEFISSVSHELRTPLTSVKGFSALLVAEKFGKLPPEAKERLIKIDENVNKLVDMVNALLDISRIESKKIEIKISSHDLVQLVKDIGEFFMPQLGQKNITFTYEGPDRLAVYMDKNLIERVLINLINNALKFTPEKGKITVGCRREDDHAIIYVRDTGYGIEQDKLDKIFEEFFRADNPINRKERGSGLGLALVNRIMEAHGEKIWAESQINRGTTFYFTLKLAKDEESKNTGR